MLVESGTIVAWRDERTRCFVEWPVMKRQLPDSLPPINLDDAAREIAHALAGQARRPHSVVIGERARSSG